MRWNMVIGYNFFICTINIILYTQSTTNFSIFFLSNKKKYKWFAKNWEKQDHYSFIFLPVHLFLFCLFLPFMKREMSPNIFMTE